MKENFKIIKCKDRVLINGQMDNSTREIGLNHKCMAKVCTNFLMVLNLKVFIIWVKDMAKV
jgi:hypothetical protein